MVMDSSSVALETTSAYIGVVTSSVGAGKETTAWLESHESSDNFTGLPTDSTSLIVQSSVDIDSRSVSMATSIVPEEIRTSTGIGNVSESLETLLVESSSLSEDIQSSVEVGSLSTSIETTSRPQTDQSSIESTTSTIKVSILGSIQVTQSQAATHSSVDSKSSTIDESVLGSMVTKSQTATQSLGEMSGSQLPIASSSSVQNSASDDIDTSFGSVDGTSSVAFATEVMSQSAQHSVGVTSSPLSQQMSSDVNDPGQIGSTSEPISASSVSQPQSSEVVTSIPTSTTTPATAKLGIDDSCDDDVSCPDNSVCHQTKCSGKRCQCQDGYFSANKGMACLKAVKLGELCNDTITCAVPFSLCDKGTCVCGRPFTRTTPNGFCADDTPTVGESCTDTCREFDASCGSDKICTCNPDFRVAEDAEVYAAGPAWFYNGRCIRESQG
ncbi:location of vulva defective 1 [Patella vulgata]|uniref:location of vulva defective 1 n=1 Tax=Patella vulgata TaxID=6465 RepID=UPI00217F7804|nr:location of vulva defective 1 [Patella vulgata]